MSLQGQNFLDDGALQAQAFLNAKIQSSLEQYIAASRTAEEGWLALPEIPTEQEIGWIKNGSVDTRQPTLYENKEQGPFKDKFEYLKTFYSLMRFDSCFPLAVAVDEYRLNPDIVEKTSKCNSHVYDNVSWCLRHSSNTNMYRSSYLVLL
jgi:hypothetical protein